MALAFVVGIVVGSLIGIAWLNVLERIKGKPNIYMLTFGVLFLTFVLARTIGGTGAVSALFLGLIIGNAPQIAKRLKFKNSVSINETVSNFHSQISFLIRSFFFVFTGLLFSISSLSIVLLGLVLSFIYLGLRFFTVKMSFLKSSFRDSKSLITIMLPQGLAAAVLASLPFVSGVPGSEVFPEIAFIVIVTTIVICTVGVAVLKKKMKSQDQTSG